MIVELDVFSGRPNPSWGLSEEQVMEVLELFKNLPPADKLPQETGLAIVALYFESRPSGWIAATYCIFRGIVIMTNSHEQSYGDVHGIEHRLLLQAAQQGYKDIVDSVR